MVPRPSASRRARRRAHSNWRT
ncbi:hypothetical protein [Nocardia sp. NPDC052566]